MYAPSVSEVANFLAHLFKLGLSYQTINCARSALSTIINFNNKPIGQEPVIKRLLKGVFEERPSLKPDYIWDVKLVLDYLATMGPANILKIKNISIKVVLLIALACAARQQTLRAIKVNNIVISEDKKIIENYVY